MELKFTTAIELKLKDGSLELKSNFLTDYYSVTNYSQKINEGVYWTSTSTTSTEENLDLDKVF